MKPTLSLRLRVSARTLFFLFTVPSLCLCPLYSQQPSRAVVEFRSSLNLKGAAGVAFAPVTKLLAVRRDDGTVRIIDVTDGSERASLALKNKALPFMQWTSDGQRLLIVSTKLVTVWDARLGKELAAPLGIKPPKDFFGAFDMRWNPTGDAILTVDKDESFKASLLDREKTTVRLWSVESGKVLFQTSLKGLYGLVNFNPNNKQLLTTSDQEYAKLWDIETGTCLGILKPPGRTWFREGSSGVFSPDGRSVAIYSYERGIYIWDCATATLKTTVALNDDDNSYGLYGFSPDGKLLAISHHQSKGWKTITSIEMRDSITGELRSTLTGKDIFGIYDQRRWSADSQTYVSAADNKKYEGKIWDVKSGRLKATFPMLLTFSRIPFDFGFKDRDSLSVHPTLPVISASNNKFVRFWNSETGELMQRIEDTGGAAGWSADGTLLLTFGKDLQVAHVWRVVPSSN